MALTQETLLETADFAAGVPTLTTTVANLTETASFGEGLPTSTTPVATILETAAFLSSGVGFSYSETLTETAEFANPAPTFAETLTAHEVAVLSSVATPEGTSERVVLETGQANSVVIGESVVNVTLTETAEFDTTALYDSEQVTVHEVAIFSSGATPEVTADQVVHEVLLVGDLLSASATYTIQETAGFAAGSLSATTTTVITEQAPITSTVVPEATETALVDETAALSSTTDTSSTVSVVAHEQAFLWADVGAYGAEDVSVWTANTVGWAMSTYAGVAMSGKASGWATVGGNLSRESGFANARIETGDESFGQPAMKSIRTVYAYGEHALPLSLTVTADVRGATGTHTYPQKSRLATDKRAVRFELGRGFRSTNFKLVLVSEGYAQVSHCVPDARLLTRAI